MSKWDGILIDGKRFEDNYQPDKFEWDRRYPHPDREDSPCWDCLHSDCQECHRAYPMKEVFVGITD